MRYNALRMGTTMQHDPRGHNDLAIADMLPGYRSLESTYNRMGYELGTIAWEPPHFPALPKPPTPIRRVDMQQPPPPRKPRTLARSASGPAVGSSTSATAPSGGRRGGSNVSANAPLGSRRIGGSSLSANAPLGGRRAGGSSLSATAPLWGAGREEGSQVGTSSTFWSLPPADLSQLSRAPPAASVVSKKFEPTLEVQLARLLKVAQDKPFAIL